MSAKLSVIFYIILCIEIGLFLTVLPWWPPRGVYLLLERSPT